MAPRTGPTGSTPETLPGTSAECVWSGRGRAEPRASSRWHLGTRGSGSGAEGPLLGAWVAIGLGAALENGRYSAGAVALVSAGALLLLFVVADEIGTDGAMESRVVTVGVGRCAPPWFRRRGGSRRVRGGPGNEPRTHRCRHRCGRGVAHPGPSQATARHRRGHRNDDRSRYRHGDLEPETGHRRVVHAPGRGSALSQPVTTSTRSDGPQASATSNRTGLPTCRGLQCCCGPSTPSSGCALAGRSSAWR